MDAQTREVYVVIGEGTPTKLVSNFNMEEGFRNFDPKPLTEEDIAWLEEHFIDLTREQYLVRLDDMKEALKHCTTLKSWERLK